MDDFTIKGVDISTVDGVFVVTFHEGTPHETIRMWEEYAASHRQDHNAKHGRSKPPQTRKSITHKMDIGSYEGYIIVGLYPDGKPCEVFLSGNKTGGTISGLLNMVAIQISMMLQFGIPLEDICRKMIGERFEPSGRTKSDEIPSVTSIIDYVARFLMRQFGDEQVQIESGNLCPEEGCGAPLIYGEGCLKCHACGYSEC